MECSNCRNPIKAGTEIVVDEVLRERVHCPFCLHILPAEPTLTEQNKGNGCAKREGMRKRIREEFVDHLLETSPDGKLHCPVCEHLLNEIDEGLLRNSPYFRCHLCGHDLATVAYRQEIYQEQHWLPVIGALEYQLKEKNCADCCYLGAIAKAWQRSYSWMPEIKNHREKLSRMVRHPYQSVPDCDLDACAAIKQYRKMAEESLMLL